MLISVMCFNCLLVSREINYYKIMMQILKLNFNEYIDLDEYQVE